VTASSPPVVAADPPSDLAELRTSARGWHGVQLAVLGFIGLCGAINSVGSNENPRWLELLAGVLVLTSLGLACVATVLVAGAAWPVHGASQAAHSAEQEVHRTGQRLRSGIVLTFLAVVAIAAATGSSWWPSSGDRDHLVQLSTADGSVCGALLESTTGTVTVEADGRRFVVPSGDVVSLRPTEVCGSG